MLILLSATSQPQIAVQGSVLHSFREMFRFEVLCAFQIGDRSSHFENAIVAARGEAEFGDRVFHDLFAVGSQHAVFPNVAWSHLRLGDVARSRSRGKA